MKSVLKIFSIIFIFYKCSRIEVKIFAICIISAGKSLPYTSKIQPLTRLSCFALMILSVSHQEKQMPAYAVACFSLACDKPQFLIKSCSLGSCCCTKLTQHHIYHSSNIYNTFCWNHFLNRNFSFL